MPQPDQDTDLERTVADIRAGVLQITDVVGHLLSAAAFVLDQLPDTAVTDGLTAQLAELRRAHGEAITQLNGFLLAPGMPASLRAAGSVWSAQVGGPVSGLAAFTTLSGVRADDHWSGRAADAYRNSLRPQADALGAVRAASDGIDEHLNAFASAIDTFWAAVGVAVLSLMTSLTAAMLTTSASGGLGIAAGVTIAIGSLVAFAVALGAAVNAFTTLANAAAERTAALQRQLADDTAFPSGRWPASATPVSSDGSITDGDDTDWHLR